jgi:hypothetical protein
MNKLTLTSLQIEVMSGYKATPKQKADYIKRNNSRGDEVRSLIPFILELQV